MTTIRKICCNDLFEITHMSMEQLTILGKEGIGFFPLEASLECMAKFSDYILVAVSPGNRIKGCNLVEAFIKIIEEKADKIDKVDHLEIWLPSTASEHTVNYLAQLGFTYEGKKLDGEVGSHKVLKKDLLGNRIAAAQS
ncbi:hypothetical protein C5167_045613 [Papaver somniferum]|uniref:N-acetyltransferase domain-containing protein n=1 Tax=Papaver somniferum TaxID=3469 RepID=A0A4Y7LDX5_PAPSO|nr:hypothetical protein C5167_045613 [Papaver somniferum]